MLNQWLENKITFTQETIETYLILISITTLLFLPPQPLSETTHQEATTTGLKKEMLLHKNMAKAHKHKESIKV